MGASIDDAIGLRSSQHVPIPVNVLPVAAQALLGKQFRVTQNRGKPLPSEFADAVVATVHPSAVLRAPDEVRDEARREFVGDLKAVARFLKDKPAARR